MQQRPAGPGGHRRGQFLLLARALRSLWLPVKALALNVLSIGAAYGLTVLIWQHGLGTQTLFGVGATGSLTIWVRVAVFAFLFGLSMDYEVFILSRMREAYDQHGDTPRAVVEGLRRTGSRTRGAPPTTARSATRCCSRSYGRRSARTAGSRSASTKS